MPIKKTTKSKPTVKVETKKISSHDCCTGVPRKYVFMKAVFLVWMIVNTVLLLAVLGQQRNVEAMRVGGYDNYKMLQKVFKSEAFQAQQRQQIQQAMQMYQIEDTGDITITE